MDALVAFIPLLPLLAAMVIGGGHFCGVLDGERNERMTANIATGTLLTTALLTLAVLFNAQSNSKHNVLLAGNWLEIGNLQLSISFYTSGLSIYLASLFAILLFIVARFAVNYMHREAGFHRFFFILCLFAAAMLLLVLSANAVLTFVGWELAGLCSYLLIAFFYVRPMAAANATRVFLTNRIGDAGFILGIGLSYLWLGSTQWQDITAATDLSINKINAIALSFTLAAMAKSAQLPFTSWLGRAMEGPTPSSAVFYGAVMVHAGVFLLCLMQPLLEQAPSVMLCIAVIGLATGGYSFFVALTQSDVKSSLILATSAQLGLMFLACGLGWWELASWHMCAHAVVRGQQFLSAPSFMHLVKDNPIKPVHPAIARWHWAYVASLQRLWLESLTDYMLLQPVRGLARDLANFEEHILDRLIGAPVPAIRSISSLAQLKEQSVGARLDNEADAFSQGSGLAGKLTQWSAALVNWFEARFILRNQNKTGISIGRQLGHTAHKFELLILRPRNLVLFVFILLLSAL